MDVFDIILGLEFWYEVNAFISPRHNQLHISDVGGSCVVPLIRVPQTGMQLSAMQIIKGFKRGEPTFIATLIEDAGSCDEAVPLPPCIEHVLSSNKDVMPAELPQRLPPRREPKTTCVTRYGAFDWLVMPFGLTNAPATDNMEDHVEHLCKVFEILRNNELYVKREKCSFAQPIIRFLGHTISHGKIQMDSDKITAINNWEAPTKVPELRSFLGMANYYRRFIFNYSAIAAPLTDLLKKDRAWNWSAACQTAFERLKLAISPSHSKSTRMHRTSLSVAS
uniref:Reverse transcriptase/retrotransposon-derived protein RNase H-like domain-containing protein n=1 Tax=Solanum lycopersicum TaxID=4081 RepID=A0A3Q7EY60_SOLLC